MSILSGERLFEELIEYTVSKVCSVEYNPRLKGWQRRVLSCRIMLSSLQTTYRSSCTTDSCIRVKFVLSLYTFHSLRVHTCLSVSSLSYLEPRPSYIAALLVSSHLTSTFSRRYLFTCLWLASFLQSHSPARLRCTLTFLL